MQYLLLIYDDEKRWVPDYDPAELKEYEVFGETHRDAIKGGNALRPTSQATTVRTRACPDSAGLRSKNPKDSD